MKKLRHIVPLLVLVIPFACSKDRQPAENPGASEYTPASGDTEPAAPNGTDAGSSTLPGHEHDTMDPPMGEPGTEPKSNPGSTTPAPAPLQKAEGMNSGGTKSGTGGGANPNGGTNMGGTSTGGTSTGGTTGGTRARGTGGTRSGGGGSSGM